MAAPPLLDETYNAANTPKKFYVLIRPRRAPGSLTKMFLILALAAAGANMWKTLDRSRGQTLFCVPRFPQIYTTTTTTTCFYCKKEKAQKPLALFAARAPPLHFGHGCEKPKIGRIIDRWPGFNRPPPNAVRAREFCCDSRDVRLRDCLDRRCRRAASRQGGAPCRRRTGRKNGRRHRRLRSRLPPACATLVCRRHGQSRLCGRASPASSRADGGRAASMACLFS